MAELERAAPEDIERLGGDDELLEIYTKQADEWQVIAKEMTVTRPGEPVTAYQVSLEQRKRWLARGELPWWKQRTSCHDAAAASETT